jgi:hypothetical protein
MKVPTYSAVTRKPQPTIDVAVGRSRPFSAPSKPAGAPPSILFFS